MKQQTLSRMKPAFNLPVCRKHYSGICVGYRGLCWGWDTVSGGSLGRQVENYTRCIYFMPTNVTLYFFLNFEISSFYLSLLLSKCFFFSCALELEQAVEGTPSPFSCLSIFRGLSKQICRHESQCHENCRCAWNTDLTVDCCLSYCLTCS